VLENTIHARRVTQYSDLAQEEVDPAGHLSGGMGKRIPEKVAHGTDKHGRRQDYPGPFGF